jgi:hypothetical protein
MMINMNGKVVEVTVPRHESGELCGSLGIEIKEVKFTDLSGGKRRMVMVDFSPNALVPLPAPSIIFAIGGTDISKKNLNLGEVITLFNRDRTKPMVARLCPVPQQWKAERQIADKCASIKSVMGLQCKAYLSQLEQLHRLNRDYERRRGVPALQLNPLDLDYGDRNEKDQPLDAMPLEEEEALFDCLDKKGEISDVAFVPNVVSILKVANEKLVAVVMAALVRTRDVAILTIFVEEGGGMAVRRLLSKLNDGRKAGETAPENKSGGAPSEGEGPAQQKEADVLAMIFEFLDRVPMTKRGLKESKLGKAMHSWAKQTEDEKYSRIAEQLIERWKKDLESEKLEKERLLKEEERQAEEERLRKAREEEEEKTRKAREEEEERRARELREQELKAEKERKAKLREVEKLAREERKRYEEQIRQQEGMENAIFRSDGTVVKSSLKRRNRSLADKSNGAKSVRRISINEGKNQTKVYTVGARLDSGVRSNRKRKQVTDKTDGVLLKRAKREVAVKKEGNAAIDKVALSEQERAVRAEEEERRRQEEAERKRQEEGRKRQEEERKRQEEERKRQEEERKRQEEEETKKKLEEERKRKEEEDARALVESMTMMIPNTVKIPKAVEKIRNKIRKKHLADKNSLAQAEAKKAKDFPPVFIPSAAEKVPAPEGIGECEKVMMLSPEEQGLVHVRETEVYVFEGAAVDEEAGSESPAYDIDSDDEPSEPGPSAVAQGQLSAPLPALINLLRMEGGKFLENELMPKILIQPQENTNAEILSERLSLFQSIPQVDQILKGPGLTQFAMLGQIRHFLTHYPYPLSMVPPAFISRVPPQFQGGAPAPPATPDAVAAAIANALMGSGPTAAPMAVNLTPPPPDYSIPGSIDAAGMVTKVLNGFCIVNQDIFLPQQVVEQCANSWPPNVGQGVRMVVVSHQQGRNNWKATWAVYDAAMVRDAGGRNIEGNVSYVSDNWLIINDDIYCPKIVVEQSGLPWPPPVNTRVKCTAVSHVQGRNNWKAVRFWV